MNVRNILVFDLDNTICKSSIKGGNVNEFLKKLYEHLQPHGRVYVVTARRRVEDGETISLNEILSYNVDKRIVDALRRYNNDRQLRDWLYYNDNEDEIVPTVEYVMRQRGQLDLVEKTIPVGQDDDPESAKINYYMGIIKMLQLEDIIQKELRYGYPIYVQFFDDSEYNLHAFRTFVEVLRNPIISKYVHFKGGTGKPVFDGGQVFSYNPINHTFTMETMPAWHK